MIDPRGGLLLAAAALAPCTVYSGSHPSGALIVLQLAAVGFIIAALAGRNVVRWSWAVAMFGATSVLTTILSFANHGLQAGTLWAGATAGAVIAAFVAGRRPVRIAASTLGVLSVALGALAVHISSIEVDVVVFMHDSAEALLSGTNPYSITFQSPYSPEKDALFYGANVVDNGHLLFGFVYPPPTLIGAVLGIVLGDVRLGAFILFALATAVIGWVYGRRFGLLVAASPGLFWICALGWVEPIQASLLAFTVMALDRKHWAAPVLLALLVTSKQYFVVMAPLAIILLPLLAAQRGGLRRALPIFAVAAAAINLPFVLSDPHGFWRSVVALQFEQPYRSDAQSLLVWLVERTGWPGASTYGWLPLVAGILTAAVGAWLCKQDPTTAKFAALTALTMLVTVLLSKQAFANYYFFIASACVISAVAWPHRIDTGETIRAVSTS